jgi:uncharacterized membrane protein
MIPIIYLRYAIGAFFILFIPGYSIIKIFFPTGLSVLSKEFYNLELITLSFTISLIVISINGLILGNMSLLKQGPITLGLVFVTVLFATIGMIREYYSRFKKAS